MQSPSARPLAPSLPWGWIDAPPSLNRLIGLNGCSRPSIPPRPARSAGRHARLLRAFYRRDARRCPARPAARWPGPPDPPRSAVVRRAGGHPGWRRCRCRRSVPILWHRATSRRRSPPACLAAASPARSTPSCSRSACRACWRPRWWRRPCGRRRQLPDAVPQPAGVAGHPRRLGRRGLRRGAGHPVVAAGAGIQALGFATGLATVAIVYGWRARCAARTRSWCWFWPASSSARSPARGSRW